MGFFGGESLGKQENTDPASFSCNKKSFYFLFFINSVPAQETLNLLMSAVALLYSALLKGAEN